MLWIAFKIYVIFEIQNNELHEMSLAERGCESLSKFMLSLRYKTTACCSAVKSFPLWIAFKIYVIFEIQNNIDLWIHWLQRVVNRFQNLCYLWDTKQPCKVISGSDVCCESLSKFMLSLRYKTTQKHVHYRHLLLWIAFKIYVIFEIQNNKEPLYRVIKVGCESLSKFMLSLRYKTTDLVCTSLILVLWIAFKIYVIFEIQNNISFERVF